MDHASPQILRELVQHSLAGLRGNMKDHIDEICNLVYEMDDAPDIPKGAKDWYASLVNMGDALDHMVYGKGGYGKAGFRQDQARGKDGKWVAEGGSSSVGGRKVSGTRKVPTAAKRPLSRVVGAMEAFADNPPAKVAKEVKAATGGFKEWATKAWDSLEDDAKEEVLQLAVAVTVTAAVALYLYYGTLPSQFGAVRDVFGWLMRQMR